MARQEPPEGPATLILNRYGPCQYRAAAPCIAVYLLATCILLSSFGIRQLAYHSCSMTPLTIIFTTNHTCDRLQVPFSAVSGASEDFENETMVWGTTIRAQKVSRDFVHFFELFIEEGGFEAKYIKLMREVHPHTRSHSHDRWRTQNKSATAPVATS